MRETLGKNHPFWRYDAGVGENTVYIDEYDDSCLAVEMLASNAHTADESPTYRIVLFGEPDAAVRLLHKLPNQWRTPARIMMNRGIFDSLSSRERSVFGMYWGLEWDYCYTNSPLPNIGFSSRAQRATISILPALRSLTHSERTTHAVLYEKILEVLRVSNPITSAIGDFDAFSWAYLRTIDGEIASILGLEIHPDSVHIGGFGTHPELRRHGYGSRLITHVTNMMLNSVSYVTFGLWSWNEAARRLYEKSQFNTGPRFISGSPTPLPQVERLI